METYQKDSMKGICRHSQSVLQDLLIKGFKDEAKDTRPRGRRGERPLTPKWHNSLDSVFTRKGSLILLDGNNAVEIYKPNKSSQPAIRGRLSDLYLPAITGPMSNLQTATARLSHSCPYLSTSRRRGSTSSINSQRAPDFNNKQSYLKAQKESKKSNVIVTMMYLGQGLPGSTRDEMKVLQQICGGENICVFKGFVQPGEQFQFTSHRHLGFPFSATIFVNGIIAARISSCCEYRYAPGFQQGRRSCFRLTRLNGGKPCYKCVNSRHGIGTPAIDSPAPALQQAINSNEGVMESCPSSPLFIPLGMERSVQKTRKLSKDGGALSTDSEDVNGSAKERKRHKRHQGPLSQRGEGKSLEESQAHKKENKPPSNTKEQLQTSAKENAPDKENSVNENKTKVPDSLQEGKTLTKRDGEKTIDASKSNGKSSNRGRLRDFYEECVEMSTGLESGLDQQKWFKVNKSERNKIKEQITSGLTANGSASEVELSEESDSSFTEARKPKMNNSQGPGDATSEEQDLQKQMDAMTEVLSNSDEVDQLILRNTGLTDELLKSLATALKRSPSEVTVINLNLNQIGPPGVNVLLDLLQAKPQIKELLLFGNQLGDLGVQALLSGLAELQDKTAALRGNSEPIHFSPVSVVIKELDLGGNGIGSDGLRVLATFMRYHSHLQYLGLAQTSCSDMEAWTVLFESLKVNTTLTHIILDESNLGDNGIKLFAEALRSNKTLRKVDLDNNGFGEVGGHYLLETLRSGGKCSLENLSLGGNYISTALMANIQQELESNRPAAL
ncbi:hypothetical protein G5714_005440 [Onychostoma macrolepis]|uniref:DUF4590 domain-containing protein n=2 Tax=Onychostoma macrolepis TaxID=369639 RepID=A0A7J6D123_9TELE|nr:hypothetical protein G5714_005440 [Onychostoma macrolepis]